MQKNDGRAIGGAGLGVADIQGAGVDLLQRGKRRIRARLDRGKLCQFYLAGLCVRRPDQAELGGGNGHGGGAKEPAAAWFIFSSILIVRMGKPPWFNAW